MSLQELPEMDIKVQTICVKPGTNNSAATCAREIVIDRLGAG
jgi:hypothetical protein